MHRNRVKLEVFVDLDPVPGTFHQAVDHQTHIQRVLTDMYPHYNPTVVLTEEVTLVQR